MCDNDINPGVIPDVLLSRRVFVASTAAIAGLATPAVAEPAVAAKDVTVPTADGIIDAVIFHPEGKCRWPAARLDRHHRSTPRIS